LAGEKTNRITLVSLQGKEANHQIATQFMDEAIESDRAMCDILIEGSQAYEAYHRFREGYIGFHTSHPWRTIVSSLQLISMIAISKCSLGTSRCCN